MIFSVCVSHRKQCSLEPVLFLALFLTQLMLNSPVRLLSYLLSLAIARGTDYSGRSLIRTMITM